MIEVEGDKAGKIEGKKVRRLESEEGGRLAKL